MHRKLSFVSILVIAAMLFTATPAAARSKIAIGISDPRGSNLAVLDEHVELMGGRKPGLWALWSDWGSRGGRAACSSDRGTCAFPMAAAKELLSQGITPVIWWQPVDPRRPSKPKFTRYKNITQGRHNAYIKRWARDLKQASRANGGRPIVVRFAHEATGKWFPWSISRTFNSMATYKAAWRHIDKLFRKVGARKYTRFLWSNLTPRPRSYPGDRYVDYVGATIMNYGTVRDKRWRSLEGKVRKVTRQARRFTKKPVFLAEVGSNHKGGNKATWIRRGYLKTFAKYPKVKAIMYLDTDKPHLNVSHPDWRLVKPKDGSAVAAYRAVAANPRFQGRIR